VRKRWLKSIHMAEKLSRSTGEAYLGIIISVFVAVYPLNWWVKSILIFVVACLVVDVAFRHPRLISLNWQYRAGLATLGLALVAAIFYKPIRSQYVEDSKAHTNSRTESREEPKIESPKTEAPKLVPPAIKTPTEKARTKNARSGPKSLSPPLQHSEEFLTYVMLYNDENKMFCTGSMGSQIRLTSCGEMANVFKGAIPRHDIKSSICVVLQHYLASIVNFAGQSWGSHGETKDTIYQDFLPPVVPPDVETVALHQLMRIPDSDALLFPESLRFEWDWPRMRLPAATRMSLVELPSENQGPVAYGVRLERTGYYRFDVTAMPRQEFVAGQTPQEYNIAKLGYDAQLKTFTFLVRIDWQIERTNDAGFVVGDYDVWANKLAKRIRDSLVN